MVRVGFFTGEIYDDTTDKKSIQECCRVVDSKNQ